MQLYAMGVKKNIDGNPNSPIPWAFFLHLNCSQPPNFHQHHVATLTMFVLFPPLSLCLARVAMPWTRLRPKASREGHGENMICSTRTLLARWTRKLLARSLAQRWSKHFRELFRSARRALLRNAGKWEVHHERQLTQDRC